MCEPASSVAQNPSPTPFATPHPIPTPTANLTPRPTEVLTLAPVPFNVTAVPTPAPNVINDSGEFLRFVHHTYVMSFVENIENLQLAKKLLAGLTLIPIHVDCTSP